MPPPKRLAPRRRGHGDRGVCRRGAKADGSRAAGPAEILAQDPVQAVPAGQKSPAPLFHARASHAPLLL